MKKIMISTGVAVLILFTAVMTTQASEYVIDTKKAHAFIQFKINHLGFSWMLGRFNDFEGTFSYDENDPSATKIALNIDVASVDTNHAPRDKHLRGADFFDVGKHPQATFVSTSFKEMGDGKAILKGKFTLRGVTKDISISVTHIGAGPDYWKGYRRGFEGTTMLKLSDYNMLKGATLGVVAEDVEMYFSFEGIRQ